MAVVLNGKKKGDKIQLCQFSNDWVMDSNGKVHLITSLSFDDDEIRQFKYSSCLAAGALWDEFELKNNRFYRKKQKRDD